MKEEHMAKKPARHNKPWSAADERQLRKLIRENTPTPLMAYELERTPDAVQSHANEMGLSTKPVNKSPYNRRPKK